MFYPTLFRVYLLIFHSPNFTLFFWELSQTLNKYSLGKVDQNWMKLYEAQINNKATHIFNPQLHFTHLCWYVLCRILNGQMALNAWIEIFSEEAFQTHKISQYECFKKYLLKTQGYENVNCPWGVERMSPYCNALLAGL